MIKPNATRRFSMSLASLILIAAPIGCNTDTPASPSVSPSTGRPMPAAPSPAAVEVDHAARAVDREVRQTSGAVDAEAVDLKQAVRETREGVKETADEVKGDMKAAVEGVKEDARKSADKALDDLLGDPKP